MAFDDWLSEATAADLTALARALLDGRIREHSSSGSVKLAGFGEGARRLLEGLETTDPKVIAWMLERLSEERRRAEDRYASVARLVWSGATEGTPGLRDTRVVLDGLFSRAERQVTIATYVIYNGRAVFAKLAQRMRELPALEVEMYVNLPSQTGLEENAGQEEAAYLKAFERDHWPAGVRLPALYYDPEGRRPGPSKSSLHAKCVVVDDRWAFVTSANFTEAAQERNIEAGVLLDHPRLAGALAGRFRALRDGERLKRMGAR